MRWFPPPDLLCTCGDPFRLHERRGKGPCLYTRTCSCRRFRLSFRMVRRWLRERVTIGLLAWGKEHVDRD